MYPTWVRSIRIGKQSQSDEPSLLSVCLSQNEIKNINNCKSYEKNSIIIVQTSHHTRHKSMISRPMMITKGRDVTHVDVTPRDRHVTTFYTSHFHDSCHFPYDSRSDIKPEANKWDTSAARVRSLIDNLSLIYLSHPSKIISDGAALLHMHSVLHPRTVTTGWWGPSL
jgi:hypothetical protein